MVHVQGRINHSGPHPNVRRPFSHTRSQDFLWACTFFSLGVHFSSPKKLTTFLVVVTFKPTLNVIQTSKQRGKNLIWQIGAPWRRGPSHGTTGTMVNPALVLCFLNGGLIYSNGHSPSRGGGAKSVTEANVPLIYSTACMWAWWQDSAHKVIRCTRVRQHVSGQCKQPLRHQATDARQPRRIRSTSKILRITVEPGWLSYKLVKIYSKLRPLRSLATCKGMMTTVKGIFPLRTTTGTCSK